MYDGYNILPCSPLDGPIGVMGSKWAPGGTAPLELIVTLIKGFGSLRFTVEGG